MTTWLGRANSNVAASSDRDGGGVKAYPVTSAVSADTAQPKDAGFCEACA